MNKIKVILCYPPERKYEGYGQGTEWLPLGITSIASYLHEKDKDLEIVLLDLFKYSEDEALKCILDECKENYVNIIGFTLLTEQRFSVLNLCNKLKFNKFNIKTVVGGAHAFIMSQQLADNYIYIDHIIRGEGEINFYNLVNNYKNNIYTPRILETKNTNLDELPSIVNGFKFFKEEIKITSAPIIFSRGCTDYCSFCSTTKFWKGYRVRNYKKVFEEMERFENEFNVFSFKFHDDCCTGHPDFEKLIKLIVDNNKNWILELTARADQFTLELIKLLKMAGCKQVNLGIESGNEELRNKMNKKLNIDLAKNNIKLLEVEGIRTNLLFIVGYQGETEDTIKETIDFIREVRPSMFCCQPLMIFPGTKIYNDLVKEKWIDDSYWLQDRPQPYYTRENNYRKLIEWQQELITCNKVKHVLICAPVNQDKKTFKLYLDSLRKLKFDSRYYKLYRFFIFHNCENLMKYLDENNNEGCLIHNNDNKYDKDSENHKWKSENFKDVTYMKNNLINYALTRNFDYIFFVDSDLILHENTFESLVNSNKDFISEIFWTEWNSNSEPMPNCWDYDFYTFNGTKRIEELYKKGIHKVGMTGACSLIKSKVLRYGVNFSHISNISFSNWEDRAFCIKCSILGIDIYTDTNYPATHLYRESETEKYIKENNIDIDNLLT